jgi:hypothetical protein
MIGLTDENYGPFLKEGASPFIKQNFSEAHRWTQKHVFNSSKEDLIKLTIYEELDKAAVSASFYLVYIFGQCYQIV